MYYIGYAGIYPAQIFYIMCYDLCKPALILVLKAQAKLQLTNGDVISVKSTHDRKLPHVTKPFPYTLHISGHMDKNNQF